MADKTEHTPENASETTPSQHGETPDSGSADGAPNSIENGSETTEQPSENPKEIGGRGGLDPARYGDWEINGRCYDF